MSRSCPPGNGWLAGAWCWCPSVLSARGGPISGRWACRRQWRVRRGVVDDLAFRAIDGGRVSTVDWFDGSRRGGAVRRNPAVVVPGSSGDGAGGLDGPRPGEGWPFGCGKQSVGAVAGDRNSLAGVRSVDGRSPAFPGPRRAGGESGWDDGGGRVSRGAQSGSGDTSDRRRIGRHSTSTGSGQPAVGDRMRTPGGFRST